LLSFLPALLILSLGAVATEPNPELAWTDLNGHEQALEEFRGSVVVLNFWATWCAPCLEEMPDLVRIQKRYGTRGVQVVGASADPVSASASVAEFARIQKINFPILLGATTDQMQALDAGVVLPATVVIDRQGHVVESISGVFDMTRLETLLERQLGERDSKTDEEDSHSEVTAADPHDHGDHGDEEGQEHDHPPPEDTKASLVPS